MATPTVSAVVTKLLASADLSAVTVKMLVSQVREQFPEVVAMVDKPLRLAVREAVEAYLATNAGGSEDAGGGGGGGVGGSGGDGDGDGGSGAVASSKSNATSVIGADGGTGAAGTDGDGRTGAAKDGAVGGGSAAVPLMGDADEEGATAAATKQEQEGLPSAGGDAVASDLSGAVGVAPDDGSAASDSSDGDDSPAVAERKRPDSGSRRRGAPAKKRRRSSGGGGGGGGSGGGGGDDELSRLLDIVTSVGLSRRSAVLSVSRLRDVDAKTTRLRRMLADKAGMKDDPLAAGRAELAAAKREVERRELLGGLDTGNIVSGGRRRRGAPVSYTDSAADVLDKLLEEEEAERAEAQDGASVADGKGSDRKPAVGRRVVVPESSEEDADTAVAKLDKSAVPSGEAGAPANEDAATAIDGAPVTGEEAGGKATESGADDSLDAGDDAEGSQDAQEEDDDSVDDDDDDDYSAGDLSEDDA